ncbi:S1-like domain-containing RNA-binding protein [Verrucomicrobiales bacterium]|nr:S1-like domain-containing RNA-binding protein [Verrucomicrobiales bacterium]
MSVLGKTNRLTITRDSDQGFYLDAGPALGEILLPSRYKADLPQDIEQGDEIDVFVHRDSEDRLVAVTDKPLAEVGQYGLFEVVDVVRNVGAFLNWGLPKDLLLPYREQDKPVYVGDKIVARVTYDKKSDRIIATTKMNRYLKDPDPMVDEGEKVDLLAFARTDLGIKVIVNNRYGGLVFNSDLGSRDVQHGEKLEGYVRRVRPDGGLDITLAKLGYERVTDLTDIILEALEKNDGSLNLGDKSSPEAIKDLFGVSKKSFKQAIGALYKKRKIVIEPEKITLA